MKGLSIEEQVIILCTRLEMSGSQQIALDLLIRNKGFSWQKVLEKANWYRTGAFLLYHLRCMDIQNAIPPWVMEELKRLYFRNGYANLQLQSELRRVLQALDQDGTPVIALKGMALLETVYPNGSLRPMSDIDLLVPQEKAEAAQARVREFGYLPVGSPEQQQSQREIHHHLPRLVNPNGGATIEVHSHIVPKDSAFRFDIAGFWKRAIGCPVAGVNAWILAPEHQLIHLAVHFFLSRRFGSKVALSQICDIAETVRRYQHEIDWYFLEKEILTQDLQGPTYCGLFLAQSLLDAPVPEDFLRRIRSNEVSALGVDLFLRRRVLDNKRVVAAQWVRPESAYNLPNMVSSVVHRIFTYRTEIESSNQSHKVPLMPVKGYLRRAIEGITLLAQYWHRPLEIWQDLKVDRWIHSISAEALAGSRRCSSESLNTPDEVIKQEDHQEVQVN